jgi:hypothetical protein
MRSVSISLGIVAVAALVTGCAAGTGTRGEGDTSV